MVAKYPDKKAFKQVCQELATGSPLTFHKVGLVFGHDFWELLVLAFMDANDAARAIQMSMLRLKAGESSEPEA